jgi:hypothetical protein
MSVTSGYSSLDELAKGATNGTDYVDTWLQRASQKGTSSLGKDLVQSNGNYNAATLDSLQKAGWSGIWAGQTGKDAVSLVGKKADGTAATVGSTDTGDLGALGTIVPMVVAGLATAGFGSGLAGLAGVGNSALGVGLGKVAAGGMLQAVQGNDVSFTSLMQSALMRSLFPSTPGK